MDKFYRSFWPDVFSLVLVFFLLLGQVFAENSLHEIPATNKNYLYSKKLNKLEASAYSITMFNTCTCKDSEGIIFRYTGEGCSASNNNQDGNKTSCSGSPGGDGINISYEGGNIPNVNIGDIVFIGGPDNDLKSETEIQVGSQSITLHTSCSQPLGIGDQFGSLELVGFISKNGGICGVDFCTPCDDGGEIGIDEAECDPYNPALMTELTAPDCPVNPQNSACPCKDSEFIIFTYTGGSCASSNNAMGNDFDCSGSLNGAASVNVSFKDGSVNVELGENFQVPRDDAKEMTISGGGSQSLELHVSCSQPIRVGDSYGGLTIAGFIYKDGSTCGVEEGEEDDLEYQWIASTVECPDDISQAIPDATSKEYDPPMIDQTTWFVRLTRKKDCVPNNGQFQNSCACKDSEFIIFRYTGGSCASSNNAMGNDFDCSGSLSGAASVNVSYKDGSANVALNETFQVPRDDAKEMTISGGGSQSLELHVSCSQPIRVGDSYGGLTVAGFIYKDGSRCEPVDTPPGEENPWVPSNCVVKRVDGINITIQNNICDINNPADPFDDTYTFDLIVTGTSPSGEWQGGFDNGFLGAFGIPPTPFGTVVPLGPFPAGSFSPSNVFPPTVIEGGLPININVQAVGSPDCQESLTVQPPDCEDPTATYGDMVFNDLDRDGIMDAGEPGVPGVFVTLSKPDGSIAGTFVTGNDGKYLFTGLAPNMAYKATFTNIPNGFQFTTPNAGDDANDSDVNPTTGMTEFTTLDPGEDDRTNDAGIVTIPPQPATYGDMVFNDLDGDGIMDNNEPGVQGVLVILSKPDGSVVGTQITDGNGKYLFTNLAPNMQYKATFSNIPNGFQFTTPNQGGDDANDSDVNPATGMNEFTTLDPGEDDRTNDAGIVIIPPQPATYGDMVFLDADSDGIMDNGESGVGGVIVTLSKPDGTVIGNQITDNNGKYLFTNLAPNMQYKATFTNIPSGFQFTTPNVGDDANDSDVNPSTGMTDFTTLDPGEDDRTNDAGLVPIPPQSATYGDMVFNDLDRDGVMDNGEPGVQGLSVTLSKPDGTIISTQITDESGKYLFTNLAPNMQYKATFSNLPDGFQFTTPNATNDAFDSDVNPNTGMTEFTTLSPGEDDRTWDAGIVTSPLGSIGNEVFSDNNNNGIKDPNEPGIGGVEVKLQDPNGTILQTTTTDGNGMYSFNNLPSGNYKIMFGSPNGFNPSPRTGFGDNDVDNNNDNNPNNGNMTDVIFISPGENNSTIDAGFTPQPPQLASVGNEVFRDDNNNGLKDPNEPGISSVEVKLQDPNGTVLQTTTTNSTGKYGFNNLPSGNYKIMFGSPTGFTPSPRTGFGDNDVDNNNDNNPINGNMTDVFFLSSGEDNPTIDAGFVPQQPQLASVGNHVWDDLNKDGFKDPGEPGVKGVEVKLQDPNGNTIAVTETDENGVYQFINLPSGFYKVMFEEVVGFKASPRTGFGDNDVDNNSDADPITHMTDVFFLSPGESNQTIDAGCVKSGAGDPDDCQGLLVTASAGKITISAIKAANTKIEYAGPSTGWAVQLACEGDCGDMYMINGLSSGEYNIKVQTFDPYCYAEYRVNVPNGSGLCDNQGGDSDGDGICDNVDNCKDMANTDQADNDGDGIGNVCDDTPNGGGNNGDCNSVTAAGGDGKITIANIPSNAVVEYAGLATGWGLQLVCNGDCNSTEMVSGLAAGEYSIKIQTFNPYCYNEIKVNVTEGSSGNPCDNQGGDSDGDGICDNVDNCSNVANSDQADNDGDGIGNVCDDTPNGGGTNGDCNSVSATGGDGKMTITNIPTTAKVEYAGPATGWGLQLVCDGDCNGTEMINNLANGEYSIKVQTYNPYCYNEIKVTVTDGGSGSPCDNQGGDSDGDGICDTVDNCRNVANTDQADNDGDGIGNVCDDTPDGNGENNNTDCDKVYANLTNGQLTVSGLGAPIVILKVFDSNWENVFECSGDKCPETVLFSTDPNEIICHLDIQFYTADWQLICSSNITVTNNSATSRNAPRLTFEAINVDQAVEMQWLTNTGWRNDRFELERSVDGISFENIHIVANTDESDEMAYYEETDIQPALGDNYYRLKQIYRDGSFNYSDVKLINFNVDVTTLNIYPNPVEKELFISLKPFAGKQVNLTLTNQFGQTLKQVNIEQVSSAPTSLNMNNIPNGLYQITIQVDGGIKPITKKILVRRMY